MSEIAALRPFFAQGESPTKLTNPTKRNPTDETKLTEQTKPTKPNYNIQLNRSMLH